MKTTMIVPGALAFAIANALFAPVSARADQAASSDAQNPTELPKVNVRERRTQDDTRPKLQHIMPMVSEIAPLLITAKLDQYDYAGATAIALVLLAGSFAALFAINLLQLVTVRRRSAGAS